MVVACTIASGTITQIAAANAAADRARPSSRTIIHTAPALPSSAHHCTSVARPSVPRMAIVQANAISAFGAEASWRTDSPENDSSEPCCSQ